MKDLIKKYLQKQVIDEVGETRPYIDPDFIDIYAGDIEKLVKNNAVLPLVSFSEERAEVCEIDGCDLRPYGDLKVCKHHFLEQIDKQT